MSLVSTLAKVAIGIAIAKGASGLMKSKSGSGAGAGDLGGLLGSLTGDTGTGGSSTAQSGGGIEDMLGGLLAGGTGGGQGGMPDGLGGLLEQLGGTGGGSGAGTGGLQDILGGLTGGSGKASGLQDILGGLTGGGGAGGLLEGLASAIGGRPKQNNENFGRVLNSSFDQNPEPEIEPTPDQEAAAGLMIRAMIQAIKSDGKMDDSEREKLIGQLGDTVSKEEAHFVQSELDSPIDVDGLVSQTPKGMETQMYAMSVLGINLDSRDEAEYLNKLASGYGISAKAVNGIHAQMGVPALYT